MNQNIKANIWKYYLFSFLSVFTLYSPFIIYYFQKLGFSLQNIAILASAISISVLIFELPSGYFADKFGRKTSLILSVALGIIAISILYFSTNYFMILFACAVAGTSGAFLSGADSALIYDTLLVLKRKKDYKKIAGKARFFSGISGVIACALGSLVVIYGIKLTILFTLLVQVALLLFTFSFEEPSRHKLIENIPLKAELAQLKNIIAKSLRNHKLLSLFIYSFFIMGVIDLIYLIYQPYFRATNLPLVWFGIVFAGLSIISAFAALKAHYIEKKLGVFNSLLFMPLLLVGALLGAGISFIWFGFAFFILREIARSFFYPVIGDYTNRIARSQERATVLSVQNMFSNVGFVIIATTFGFFSDNYGLRLMLIVTGLIVLAFTILVPVFIKKVRERAR